MARTNKYTSLNFNDIYEKKTTPNSSRPHSSSPSSSNNNNNKTIISNSRIHGHMLVLSRPTPKPISIPIHQQQPKLQTPSPEKTDSISLRPQGSTGSAPVTLSSSPVNNNNNNNPVSPLPKSNRFVPPHLRPGFVGREEKPLPGGLGAGPGPNHIGLYGENGRPKSGGGMMNRPGSSGSRPSSSG